MMGNCHVPFLGEEREVILVEPVARPKKAPTGVGHLTRQDGFMNNVVEESFDISV